MTVYFYLKKSNSPEEQPIYCRIQCGMKIEGTKKKPDRATFATNVFCTVDQWEKETQRIKGRTAQIKKKNQSLSDLEKTLNYIEENCRGVFGECSSEDVKEAFTEQNSNTKKESLFLSTVLSEYVGRIKSGTIRKTDGRKFKPATIRGWQQFSNIIYKFSLKYPEPDFNKHNFDRHHLLTHKKKLATFYAEYYNNFRFFCLESGLRDNSISEYTNKLRAIFGYVKSEHFINTNDIQKKFYSSRDNFEVVAIPEEVFFEVIKNYSEIRNSIKSKNRKNALDYFVLGGSVALRKSDMINLDINRLTKSNGQYLLNAVTKKTETPIQFPLPKFLSPIIDRNMLLHKKPFPPICYFDLNRLLKELCLNLPNFDTVIEKVRVVNGEKKSLGKFPLHKLVSPHMLRRTAVSNMLAAGVPVNVIKAIGGWAPSSKTFEERYLAYNQSHANAKISMYYERIEKYINGKVS